MIKEPYFEKNKPRNTRFEAPYFIDPLTGLFNRYYIDQFIPQEIKKASLSNYPLSILMIDVDKFKKINDSYGHLCGDRVLTQVADIIKKSVRQTDTAIRYAGDEFMVLLSGADSNNTVKVCNNIVAGIERAIFTGDKNQKIIVTLSIGYAIFPDDAKECIKLIDMADKALYLSKKRGRNKLSSAKEVTTEEVSSLVAMKSFPCGKFIDREQELETLKKMASSTIKHGALRAAFIISSSGVGKSRILEEITSYIGNEGVIVYCSASLQRSQDPYYLFAKGLNSYIDKEGIDNPEVTDILLKMSSSEISELSLLIPQLRKLVKKPSDLTVNDKGRRFLIFKAFLSILNGLSDLLPVFLIFDDTQWADEASLELVRYLIKQGKDKNISVFCALVDSKPSDTMGDNLIQNLLDETGQLENIKKIALNNLSSKDTALMVSAIFPGTEKSKDFTDLIYETTKGNPHFIEETLKWLVEKGIIFYHKNMWNVKPNITRNDIPVSLDEIIKSRIGALDDETKEMILQAAVIGKNFHADILNKLEDKNEGFVSELIERAKDMRFVGDMDKTGGFNFVNEHTHDILYSQINNAHRDKMHYKIAQTLVDGHKDNLYDVAGEAAFYYNQLPGQETAIKLGKELLEKTKELFNPHEINDYLQQLTKDLLAGKDKISVELSDKMMKEATKFIRFMQGAIKKIRLYPPTSSVRLDTVKEVYSIIMQIFNEAKALVITEVEKSLVINGKRISPTEADYAKADDFLYIMMEHSIKTLSFKKGLREEEVNILAGYLSQSRKDVVDNGGWAAVINKEGLEHVGIDELHFISVDEYAQVGRSRKSIQDLMLMEFLMGKIDHTVMDKEEVVHNIEKNPQAIAQTIMDIANIATEKDKNHDEAKVVTDAITKIDSQFFGAKIKGADRQKDMARVILELEPGLRHKVISSFLSESREEQKKVTSGIMGALTDDFLIDVIIEKYRDSMCNPLLIKKFIDEVLIEVDRKKEVLAKLEPKLLGLDINKTDLSFIMGRITWGDFTLERKMDILLGLPQEYYSHDVLDKVDDLFKELDSKNKKEGAKEAILRFLAKTKKLSGEARKNLLRRISDFIKEPFERTEYILERIAQETDPVVLAGVLEMAKYLVSNFETEDSAALSSISKSKKSGDRFTSFTGRLFPLLLKRAREEEVKGSQAYEELKNFASDNSLDFFIKRLIHSVIDTARYDIKDVYLVFKDRLIDVLIELSTKKNMDLKDPFKEFLIRRQIAGLLMEFKEASLNRLKKICLESVYGITVPLIELIGYIQSGEMVDTLSQFIHHRDSAVRTAVIQALSEIGEAKAAEVLLKISKEEQDVNIRNLANARLQKIKRKIQPQK